jgi:RHS repeat-associated protein
VGPIVAFILAVLVFPAAASAAECTNTWTSASGLWKTAANWSAKHVPTSSDVACIGSGKTVAITESANQAAVIQGEGKLELAGGSLELTSTTEVSSIGVLRLTNSTLKGPAVLEISSQLTWLDGGAMSGAGSTVVKSGASASLFASSGCTKLFLTGRRFINEGTTTFESNELDMSEGAVLENKGQFLSNSESSCSGAAAIQPTGAGPSPSFVNKGTLGKTVGTGASKIGVNIENTGTAESTKGLLTLTGGGSSTSGIWKSVSFKGGTFSLTKDSWPGSVVFTGAAVTATEVSGSSANVEVTGGSLAIASGSVLTLKTLRVTNGAVTGSGDLKVSSELKWLDGGTMSGSGKTIVQTGASGTLFASSGCTKLFLTGRRFINEGTTAFESNELDMSEGAVLENKNKFIANSESSCSGAPAMLPTGAGPSPVFINNGTIERTIGFGTTKITVGTESYGRIDVKKGQLKLENPITLNSSNQLSHRSHCGDPVECASGNFAETQTDIAIAGRGVGLTLSRTYSAQAAATASSPGVFGYGWTNSFGDRLVSEEGGKKMILVGANGSATPFTESGKSSFTAPAWSQSTLSGNAESGYTLVLADQTSYLFSGAGKLESITDRNGNATILAYNEAGQLETVTDPAGRKLTLAYNGEGLVESVKDPMGYTVKYTYESKNLKTVTEAGEVSASWQFKYDGSHRITSMTDGRGGKTTNEYDGSSRVISQTDPAEHKLTFEYAAFRTKVTNKATGAVTDQWFTSNNQPWSITRGFGTANATTETFTYDTAGNLLTKTDGNAHTTTFTYDGGGNRTSEKDALGNETKWTYDGNHSLLTETSPNGEKTTIVRDPSGNPESISRPAPGEQTQTSVYTYDANRQMESVTDPLERTWTYEYSNQGDRISETDPEGNKRTWGYDQDSRLTSATSARGNEEGAEPSKFTTTIERDARGRAVKVTDPLEGITKYVYDGNGNLESETDAGGHKTKYIYNADNDQTKIEKPNGDIWETAYDGANQITSQTDGNKRKRTYVRNILGQITEVVDPLSRKTLREYDLAGNLKSITDPAKRKTSYVYDTANRVKEISYSDGVTPNAKFSYDADGNLVSMSDGTGESTLEYDQLGRMIKSKNGHGDVVGYEYDLGNEQTKVTYPNGKSIVQEFDDAGRLEKVTDWLGGVTSFAYNRNSSPREVIFPEGTANVDEYSYDRADRLAEVKIGKGGGTLASLVYARDKIGQVESQASSGLPGAAEETITYDFNNRLTKSGGSSYEYDAANNPTKVPGSANIFDVASQLEKGTGVAYSYDEEGERTKRTPTSGPATNYKYDQAGRLTSVERSKEGEIPAISEGYTYDGGGLRASQTVSGSTSYLTWNTSASLPLLLSASGYSYIYGPDGLPIEQISSEELPTYYHHDQIGSTRVLTSSSGAVTGTFTYAAYGGLTGSTGSQTTPLGYAGQYTDSQSGLQYLRGRYYDPATAQFMTRDPLTILTREPFVYGKANPLTYVDPSGMGACVFGFIDCDETDDPCDSILTGPLLPACLIPESATPAVTDFLGGAGDELLSPPGSGLGPIPSIEPGPWLRGLLGIGNVDLCSTVYGAGRGTAMAASLVRGLASGAEYAGKYGPRVHDGLREASRKLDEKFVHVPLP